MPVVVNVLLGVLVIGLMAGLVWALWAIVRRSAARPRQTVSTLEARIAAATGPSRESPSAKTIVVRASTKASLAIGGGLGVFAWLGIGSFALRDGGAIALVLGLAAAVGCAAFVRRAARRPVQFSLSNDGFALGSGQRFVPWNEVEEIRVAYHQGSYTEEHSLILDVRHDPSVRRPFITTNRTNPDRIDVSLDGVSPPWRDVVVGVAALSGRPVRQVRESAIRLSRRSLGND